MLTPSSTRILVLVAIICACSAVDIEKGWITLETRTGDNT